MDWLIQQVGKLAWWSVYSDIDTYMPSWKLPNRREIIKFVTLPTPEPNSTKGNRNEEAVLIKAAQLRFSDVMMASAPCCLNVLM